jgi:hypothetical protein
LDRSLARTLYRVVFGLAIVGLFLTALHIYLSGFQTEDAVSILAGVAILLIGIAGLRKVATPAPANPQKLQKGKPGKPSGATKK